LHSLMLYMDRLKPGETLVKVCSSSDVQINWHILLWGEILVGIPGVVLLLKITFFYK
jgi:hypothetical protein